MQILGAAPPGAREPRRSYRRRQDPVAGDDLPSWQRSHRGFSIREVRGNPRGAIILTARSIWRFPTGRPKRDADVGANSPDYRGPRRLGLRFDDLDEATNRLERTEGRQLTATGSLNMEMMEMAAGAHRNFRNQLVGPEGAWRTRHLASLMREAASWQIISRSALGKMSEPVLALVPTMAKAGGKCAPGCGQKAGSSVLPSIRSSRALCLPARTTAFMSARTAVSISSVSTRR